MKKRNKEKSTDLFDLIQSLTMQEKRYFKIFSQRHVLGEENNYLNLFTAIEEQAEYDEEALLKKFAKEKFSKQLHVAKNYLYELILKSMRVFHSKKTFQNEIRELLDYADFLLLKKQWNQFHKIIEKAKKLSLENDIYTGYIEAVELELFYMRLTSNVDWIENDAKEVYGKRKKVIDQLNNFHDYVKLGNEIYVLGLKTGTDRVEQQKIFFEKKLGDHFLLEKKENALSDRSAILYYHFKGIYHLTQGEEEKALEQFILGSDFIKKEPNRLKQYIRSYLTANDNVINVLLENASFEKTLKYINNIKEIPTGILLDNAVLVRRYYNRLLSLFIRHGRFEESRGFLGEVEKWVSAQEDDIAEKHQLLEMNFCLAYLNFGIGEFKKALQWCNLIEQQQEDGVREDIYRFSKVLRILIHYELNDMETLPYQIRSATRYLAQKKKLQKTEIQIFDFLEKKIHKANTQREIVEAWKKLKENISDSFKIAEERVIEFEYFDFISWIESKIEKKSFAEIAKRNVK